MEKAGSYLETLCTKAVFLISTGMFGCLSFWAAKYIHEFPMDYSAERVTGTFDSFLENVLVFLLVLIFVFMLQKLLLRGTEEKQKRKIYIFVTIDILLVGIFAVIWVAGSHIMPYADQHQVYLTAIEFSKGIYRDMEAYFYMCPQQYGLAFLYECVLWIWESYHLIQYINVIFLIMIYYFGFKISEDLFNSPKVGLYTVLVMNGFLPLVIYVNFVYGEMGTIAMSLCSVWAVLKWIENGRKRYMAVAAIAMVLAMMVRMNMVIVAIALAIILVIVAVKCKNWKACILVVLLFVLPIGSIRAVEMSYEARSGLEVGRGIPNILIVAMGMQQSWQGAGAYNAYNHMTFWGDAGGDTDKAEEIAWEYIEGRVQEMAADISTTRYFYQSKIWEQWNVGSLGSLFMTDHFDAAPFALAQSVYAGVLQGMLLKWMDKYLFAIYFSVFSYSLFGLIKGKDIRRTIFPLIAIGGMIFSLLWESKSRYVFPYVVMVLPCMAAALNMYITYLEKGIALIVNKVYNL